MFKNTKVGDLAWSAKLGNCKVVEIKSGKEERQRCAFGDFVCQSEVNGAHARYYWDGREYVTDVEPSLSKRSVTVLGIVENIDTRGMPDDMEFML